MAPYNKKPARSCAREITRPPRSILSPQQLAEHLGLCTKTVLKLVKSGEIDPVYRMNKRSIRIPLSSVDAYLERCSRQSGRKSPTTDWQAP